MIIIQMHAGKKGETGVDIYYLIPTSASENVKFVGGNSGGLRSRCVTTRLTNLD